jgi:RHS repeat-associated protein
MLEGSIDDVRFEQVRYLYDGLEVLHEHSSRQDHQTIAFYRAGGRLVAQFRYSTSDGFGSGQFPRMYLDYYSHDGLGSVATLTHYEDDENHQPIRYRYSAFGAIVQGDFTNNPYGYTSRRFDHENGFYHYHFRKYDPVTGTWLTPDPIGIGGGINLYRFVSNNPVNYVDWLGLYSTDADEDANSVGVGNGLEDDPTGLGDDPEGWGLGDGDDGGGFWGWVSSVATAPISWAGDLLRGIGRAAVAALARGAAMGAGILVAAGAIVALTPTTLGDPTLNEQHPPGTTLGKKPTGAKGIDKTKWTRDHGQIKKGVGARGDDNVVIDENGDVWLENPDGSFTNHGYAGDYTGSGKASGENCDE